MTITINTDASFYEEHRAGGFACWIASDIGRIKHSGVFKEAVINSQDAEFKAIINALHIVSVRITIPIKKIIINTDCESIIKAVTLNKHPNWCNQILTKYKEKIRVFGKDCVIELRHVPAHKHTSTAKHWVNNWCDKQAKKAVRKKIFG